MAIAVNAVKRRKTPATKLSGFSFLQFLMRVLRVFETSQGVYCRKKGNP